MEIQSIHIQGFKSLEDVIFEPNKGFSCLVGSNGAGKSNFCDSLLFFKNVILNGVSSAIQEIGDKNLITDSEKTSFSITLRDPKDASTHTYDLLINVQEGLILEENLFSSTLPIVYSRQTDKIEKLSLDKIREILDSVSEDVLKIKEIKEKNKSGRIDQEQKKRSLNAVISVLEEISQIKTQIPEKFKDTSIENLSPDKTGLSSYYENEEIYKFIKNFNVYRINPLVPKSPNKIFNKSNLLMYGQNLSTILMEIQKDEYKWRDLHELLSLIVPSIDEIELKKGELDEYLSLYFKENNKPLPAISISDGTIYTLAILTTLLWNEDKNTLIVIEEPERGIHPQAIVEIISFIKQIIIDKKLHVIVTTHSETVVRNCELDELWLVDKIDGKTHLKNAKKANPHLEETTLDQAWLMNLLNGGLPW